MSASAAVGYMLVRIQGRCSTCGLEIRIVSKCLQNVLLRRFPLRPMVMAVGLTIVLRHPSCRVCLIPVGGFAADGGVDWLRDVWPVGLFATFGRCVRMLFLLLLVLLLLLLLWLLVFDLCNFRGHGIINEFVQGVKPGAGGCHRSNFFLERVVEACLGNIIEGFFMHL